EGFVTEATGANLFAVRGGALFTPPAEMALEGITRQTVFDLAADLKIPVCEKRLTRDDVYTADEVFLTGTAAEITSVRELDGRAIGDGSPRKITATLQEQYAAHVRGRAGIHRGWLTRVEA